MNKTTNVMILTNSKESNFIDPSLSLSIIDRISIICSILGSSSTVQA